MTSEVFDQCGDAFAPDGALRDIYVLGVGRREWQQAYELFRNWPGATLRANGEPVEAPLRVDDVFALAQSAAVSLSFVATGIELVGHFFSESVIELDFLPQQVSDPVRFAGLGVAPVSWTHILC